MAESKAYFLSADAIMDNAGKLLSNSSFALSLRGNAWLQVWVSPRYQQ
jgi:hypothetical protein